MHWHRARFPELSNTPHRVLMTADPLGGVWTYALELARTLCEQDVEIALATMGAPLTAAQWREAGGIPNLGIFESSYKLEWMNDPWDDIKDAGEWLLDLERHLRPDIIHLNHFTPGALPWRAPRLVVAHSCMLGWWQAVKGEPAPPEWNRYRQAVGAGLAGANLLVAPTRAMLRDLARFYGPLPHMEVISNGREVSFHHVPKEQFIFSAGRLWNEAKNMSALDAAAPDVNWPICVAGETRDLEGKPARFENVRWLGHLTAAQMAEQLERAPIFCLPTRYESFGMGALEAALANCALVLGDIPALREIWRETAVYVNPDDPKALATELNRLIAEPERRADLADRAHNRALEFTTFRMASSYLALYSELTQPQPTELVPVE
jgi:glycosyltransferase involved in cell wall biosynthesis